MQSSLERFERFVDLPYELRQAIWHAALDGYLDSFPARLFQIDDNDIQKTGKITYFYDPGPPPTPPVALACHESRAVAASYYTSCEYQGYHGLKAMSAAHWIRPERDVLYLAHPTLWTYSLILEVTLPRHFSPPEAETIHNLGMNFFNMNSTNYMRLALPKISSRCPLLRTLYVLVPQRHRVMLDELDNKCYEANCCTELPSDMVNIPDWYDDLDPGFFDQETADPETGQSWSVLKRWSGIRARMTDIIRDMVGKGEIPRELELQGAFIVRPECPGDEEEGWDCDIEECSPRLSYTRKIPIPESPSVGPHWGWKYEHPLHSEDDQPMTSASCAGDCLGKEGNEGSPESRF
ncbi:hypothetical protein F5Y13DRAFT_206265 [Hypoxylon sp. FL1857]|nr:hypothetical protein F5Y13DRAFT_206265 [Hypoxylon sp. FL1857]